MCGGVFTYVLYVGSLWYFDEVGKFAFPIVVGVIIGIGAGMVFITAGYIQTAYPEEGEKARYVTTQLNLQAVGSAIGGIIPVVINRDSDTAAGVPRAVYISFIVIMSCAALLALLLLPAHKLRRDDGSIVAADKARGPWEELKANLLVFTDFKLLLMIPAFLPAECFLVYSGSVNGLQWILDNKRWQRRTRALIGLTVVAVPLVGAWVWEIVRVRGYNRHAPLSNPTDWSDREFGWIFVLFTLNWISSSLWQYVITYFIGALTNSPTTLAHYAGVFRGVLGAGEAICFGLDSIRIPYIDEAGGIFAFYCVGLVAFYYLAWYHIDDSNYFKSGEEGAVVPNHILKEKGLDGQEMVLGQAASVQVEVNM
ncbi:hypothetical protein LTR78_006332 [Recurvomyces mirabilis]|uniref:Uncharacterized protein n=1 Tax=Recurvomyces mirabilis TaxID=574656 RepID=A0AAE1C0C2_9PEZI|nr:hypothetical protein LTR78_006332 [Recurvomyces mirabilis]KAK5152221.1 hypothetical protein LTS14_008596 [Recurvomyces mirabilis]